MSKERWQQIQSLFDAAAALPGEQREAFLDERCGDDVELKREVVALLANDPDGATSDRFANAIGDEQQALGNSGDAADRRGEQLGVYTIVDKIAEGGMGEVYEARQTEPIKRSVALKVVHSHLASSTVIGRFEAERQTLALMDHDGIAKIFDAGTTDSGQPYFVMELVDGTPIDHACTEQQLPLEERLRLFLKVCSGVQHAHQKGVIHRDLKPSNILVVDGDDASVRIIDFGIAKLRNVAPGDPENLTQLGMTLGTPEYMSPEQADTMGRDIDTRTDIYALGAVLYKMLTGRTALALDNDRNASQLELLKAIKESQPETPSARVQREGTTAAGVTQTPTRYAGQLRGELDWIVMRALAKSRDDRYPSASALAADIERYLNDRPVEARPPSRLYQLQKFVKRNMAASIAGVGITLALVIGLIVSTQATSRALEAEAEAIEAGAEAMRQVRIAGANIRFLTSVLSTSDPTVGHGEMTAKQMLEVAVNNVDEMLADDPEVRASVYTTIGRVYRNAGFLERASDLFGRALAEFDDVPIEGNERRISHTMNNLSTLERVLGNLDRALELGEQSLEIRLRFVEPTHEFVGRSYSLIGLAKNDMGLYEDAEAALILARDIAAGDMPDTPMQAWGLYFMGRYLREQGRYDEALAHQEQAAELFGRFPGERRNFGAAQLEKGLTLVALGDSVQGRPVLAEAHEILVETYEPHNVFLGIYLMRLAEADGELGEWDAAREKAQGAIAILGDLPIENAFYPAAAYEQLALAQANLGDMDAAFAAVEKAEAIRARTQAADHPRRRRADLARARVYLVAGDKERARQLLVEVAEHLHRTVGEDHVQSRQVAGLLEASRH